MDETNHPFTTDIGKGGTRSISYGCDKIDREDRRGTRWSRLTTNVYAINSRGGVLPPFFIFDSLSQHSSNYQVQSVRCEILPKVWYLFHFSLYLFNTLLTLYTN